MLFLFVDLKLILAPDSARICAPHSLGLITASWLTALSLLNAFFLCTQQTKTFFGLNLEKPSLENSKKTKTSLETRKSLESSWYVWPLVYRNCLWWVAKDRGGWGTSFPTTTNKTWLFWVCVRVCMRVYVCLHLVIDYSGGGVCVFQIALLSSELF